MMYLGEVGSRLNRVQVKSNMIIEIQPDLLLRLR